MVAPVLAMAPAIMSFVTIPFSENIVAHSMNVGVLMIFAFASLSGMSILLAGWGSRNKYGVMASVRAVSQNISYEIPMLITVITIVMIAGTMNLKELVAGQAGGIWNWNVIPSLSSPLMPVSFLIFFIC